MDRNIRHLMTALLITGCADEGSGDGSNEWTDATETFSGSVKGVEMIFQHKDTLHYRLIVAGEVVEGELDIERGFGGDEGVLVYVLNIDRPEAEQAFFVKRTNGEIMMLDQHRRPIERSHFKQR